MRNLRTVDTEAEWLTCADPGPLTSLKGSQRSQRKHRLFACACVRRIWKSLTDERSRVAVEVGERYADRLAKKGELSEAMRQASQASQAIPFAEYSTHWAAGAAVGPAVVSVSYKVAYLTAMNASRSVGDQECPAQADLARCVFGNPFRPVCVNPAWLTATIVSLAQACYDERQMPAGELDRHRLSILADALEEQGAADLMAHLRDPRPHVRGCWAIDLILGKQ